MLGEIDGRFERKGLKIIAMKMVPLTDNLLEEHYAHLTDKPFSRGSETFMMQTPVIAMVLEGLEVVAEVRKLVGSTNPQADAGTIRTGLSMNVPST